MEIIYDDVVNEFIPVKRTLKWVSNSGKRVEVSFNEVVDAVYSEKYNSIVVLVKSEIQVYDLEGKKSSVFYLNIGDDYEVRGLNMSSFSESGVSVVALPIDKKNKWGDMVQFELFLDIPRVGQIIGIYR